MAKANLLSVSEVFKRSAPHYDVMNDLMSGGLHRLWKKELVNQIPARARHLIDVASGSGDIAFRAQQQNKNLYAVCGEVSLEMLDEAQTRLNKKPLLTKKRTALVQLDGTALPFAENSFDCYTISFGLRNIQDRLEALKEAHRVLRAGGKFLCLEFNNRIAAPVAPLYRFYADKIIPAVAQKIMGDKEPYRYLVETIKRFPPCETIAALMQQAGFSKITLTPMTTGIVVLYSAYKI